MGEVLHSSRSGEPKFYEMEFAEAADGDLTLPAKCRRSRYSSNTAVQRALSSIAVIRSERNAMACKKKEPRLPFIQEDAQPSPQWL
jgi:hypothetical protein